MRHRHEISRPIEQILFDSSELVTSQALHAALPDYTPSEIKSALSYLRGKGLVTGEWIRLPGQKQLGYQLTFYNRRLIAAERRKQKMDLFDPVAPSKASTVLPESRSDAKSDEVKPPCLLSPKEITRQETLRTAFRIPGLWEGTRLKHDWVELAGPGAPMVNLLGPYLGPGKFIGVDHNRKVIEDCRSYWTNRTETPIFVHAKLESLILGNDPLTHNVGSLIFDSTARPLGIPLNILFRFAGQQTQRLGCFFLVINTCLNGVSASHLAVFKQRVESHLTEVHEGIWCQYKSHTGSPSGMLMIRVLVTPEGTYGLRLPEEEYHEMKLPKKGTESQNVLDEIIQAGVPISASHLVSVPVKSRAACLAYLSRTGLIVRDKQDKYTPHPELVRTRTVASASPRPDNKSAPQDIPKGDSPKADDLSTKLIFLHEKFSYALAKIEASADPEESKEAVKTALVKIFNSETSELIRNHQRAEIDVHV